MMWDSPIYLELCELYFTIQVLAISVETPHQSPYAQLGSVLYLYNRFIEDGKSVGDARLLHLSKDHGQNYKYYLCLVDKDSEEIKVYG
jgi:hypothetical protein